LLWKKKQNPSARAAHPFKLIRFDNSQKPQQRKICLRMNARLGSKSSVAVVRELNGLMSLS